MSNFLIIDLERHREILVTLLEEFFTWVYGEIKMNYHIEVLPDDMSTLDFASIIVDEFAFFSPPEGISYLIYLDEQVAGMGALRILSKNIGEITRMYVRPEYRGKGLGKQLLEQLLKKGEEFGFSTIYLNTAHFMKNAQKMYTRFGFIKRGEYPESELPDTIKPFFLYMEKEV